MDSHDNLTAAAWLSLAFWLGLALILGGRHAVAQALPQISLIQTSSERVSVSLAEPTGTLPTGTSEVLLDLAARASVIFAGQVLAITPGAGFVDVRFRVDSAVRGCSGTEAYVLREWAGLWTSRHDRYRLGQRLLMLLPARGPSGISAPVSLSDGAIPLIASNPEPLIGLDGNPPPDNASPVALTVDLRWLQTRISRGSTTSSSSTLFTAQRAVSRPEQTSTTDWTGPTVPLAATPTPTLSNVLALLTTGAASASR